MDRVAEIAIETPTRTPLLLQAVAALGRRYPFFSGNYSLVNSSRFSGLFPRSSEVVWCPSPGGRMLVPLQDDVGRCIYFTGDYDRKISWLVRKILRSGDTALDIGANLGVVTLVMAKAVGPRGIVHSFEPNPIMTTMLRKSIDRSYQNVRLHDVALGSADAVSSLYVPPSNIGAGSLVRFKDALHTATVMCQVRKLSDIAKNENISSIRFVKIDVEGFENEVLLGAEDILSELRPDAIVLETNQPSDVIFRDSPPISTLLRHRYRFLAIPKTLLSMDVVDFDIEQQKHSPSHDVLAVPAEKYETILKTIRS
jgi:FkbM family methyltransferase